MANTIIIPFEPCEPPPDLGYEVVYRPKGDLGAYRVWPYLFQASPAVFTDLNDPDGTEYEGFIRGVCNSGRGIDIPWDTGDASDSDSVPGDDSPEGCDGEGLVVVNNNLPAGTVNDVEGIAGFDAFPPPLLPGPLSTRSGTHTAFTGIITISISGSGANGNAVLFQHEVVVGCVNITDPGLYAFPETTFDACDTILVLLMDGDCD
jgi:hypothetical protein